MDKILERIVETDRAAREKVNKAKQRLDAINDEIASSGEELDRELKAKAEESVLNTKKQTEEKMRTETARIDAYFAATQESLNKSYEENHERWAEEIFKEATE